MKELKEFLIKNNWRRIHSPFVNLWIKNGLMIDLNNYPIFKIRKKETDGLYYHLLTDRHHGRLKKFIKTLDYNLTFTKVI